MSELRWILLVAGLALIVGVYVWGVRSRRRSATPDVERPRRIEPAPSLAPMPAAEVVRREPRLNLDDDDAEILSSTDTSTVDFDVGEAVPETATTEPLAARVEGMHAERTEPTLTATPAVEAGSGVAPSHAASSAKPRQKILSVRVTAPLPARFDGTRLREALHGSGLKHGRFDIYHRLAPDGRPIISLASLVEPGTFDPAAMDGAAYPGVAVFAVLPGPVSALDALEDLLVTSRSLATQLKGTLLDDRGSPLTLQRIAHMRDEVLAFERDARSTSAAG
jgi:cell division protein ZipA